MSDVLRALKKLNDHPLKVRLEEIEAKGLDRHDSQAAKRLLDRYFRQGGAE